MLTHSQRVEKIKKYAAKNKFFTVIAAAVILLLIGQVVFNKNDSDKKKVAENKSISSEEDKCCEQGHYSYSLLSKTTDYVICNADYHIIEFFIGCMKSEHEETIKMLCSLSKSTLIDRLNGMPFEEESEKWIDEIDLEVIKEAIDKYDEPYVVDNLTCYIKEKED